MNEATPITESYVQRAVTIINKLSYAPHFRRDAQWAAFASGAQHARFKQPNVAPEGIAGTSVEESWKIGFRAMRQAQGIAKAKETRAAKKAEKHAAKALGDLF